MSVTHATASTVGTPAAGHIPTAGAWDAAHTGAVDGLTPSALAVTAAATPGADITGAALIQFITITSGDANHWVNLPAPVPGMILILINGATGYELRSSSPTTIAINGGTGAAAESAIAASTMVVAVCKTATAWAAFSLAGTTLAAVEAAA
jgi:hypothetical protein